MIAVSAPLLRFRPGPIRPLFPGALGRGRMLVAMRLFGVVPLGRTGDFPRLRGKRRAATVLRDRGMGRWCADGITAITHCRARRTGAPVMSMKSSSRAGLPHAARRAVSRVCLTRIASALACLDPGPVRFARSSGRETARPEKGPGRGAGVSACSGARVPSLASGGRLLLQLLNMLDRRPVLRSQRREAPRWKPISDAETSTTWSGAAEKRPRAPPSPVSARLQGGRFGVSGHPRRREAAIGLEKGEGVFRPGPGIDAHADARFAAA